jgi:hypothetical protein
MVVVIELWADAGDISPTVVIPSNKKLRWDAFKVNRAKGDTGNNFCNIFFNNLEISGFLKVLLYL